MGRLVVVRTNGVEARHRGRGGILLFDGDVPRTAGKGSTLIETDEGTQVALNGASAMPVLSRKPCTPPTTTDVRPVIGWGRPLLP